MFHPLIDRPAFGQFLTDFGYIVRPILSSPAVDVFFARLAMDDWSHDSYQELLFLVPADG